MSIIKLPFLDLLTSLDGTHYWPMTGATETEVESTDSLSGGGDLTLSNESAAFTPQHTSLLSAYTGRVHPFITATNDSHLFKVNGIPTHVANQGITSWSMICFFGNAVLESFFSDNYLFGGDIAGVEYYCNRGGHSDTRMAAVVFDANAGEFRFYYNGALVDTVSGSTSDLTVFYVYKYLGDSNFGELGFFTRALTLDEIDTIDTQRRFLGKISGTITLDGAGSPATVKSITRSGSYLAGEATAAADGTYELWVVEPSEQDILAIPPDGVAARPLAHGPIIPIDQN